MGIQVLKGSGEKVEFNPEKLKQALAHSGANAAEQNRVANLVEARLYDGIPTRKI